MKGDDFRRTFWSNDMPLSLARRWTGLDAAVSSGLWGSGTTPPRQEASRVKGEADVAREWRARWWTGSLGGGDGRFSTFPFLFPFFFSVLGDLPDQKI